MHRDLPNLDLLRTLAVLFVIIDHTLLALKIVRIGAWESEYIGQVGVFMFFVHTALVLMWSLQREPNTVNFYIRRAFRIYPLAWVVLIVTLLFKAPTDGTPHEFFQYVPVSVREAFGAFLLMQNFYGARNIIGVLWSLPYEVEMYIVLPVLFFFVRKNFRVGYVLLLWVLVVVFCHRTFPMAGHNLATMVPLFLPGIMAYVEFDRVVPRVPAWLFAPFILVLLAAFMHHPVRGSSWALCLVLGLALPWFNQIQGHGLKRVTKLVADHSYSLYLLHPLCIVLGMYLFRGPWPASVAIEILALVPLTILAYRYIEKPLIRLGARQARRFQAPRQEAV